jgi:HSP20 family molecular chaperone IbpA
MSFYRPAYSSAFFPRLSFAPMSSLFDDAFWSPAFPSLYLDEPDTTTAPSTSSSSSASSNKQRRLQQDSTSPSTAMSPIKSGSSGGTQVATRNESGQQASRRQQQRGLSLLSPMMSGAVMPEMAVDVTSTSTTYNVHASVPGIDKRDISVTIEDGNVLRIQAERRSHRSERRGPSSTSTEQHDGSAQQSQPSQPAVDEQKAAPSSNAAEKGNEKGNDKGAASSDKSSRSDSESSAMQQSDGSEAGSDLQYHHVESYYGRVERRLQLPEDVDVDQLTAKHDNGVLSITIPRLQDKRPQQRRIDVM